MVHSVTEIGQTQARIYNRTHRLKTFDEKAFLEFAAVNVEKYNLIQDGNDLLVTTWHSDELVKDYLKTLHQ